MIRTVVTITIFNAPDMTERGRKRIAQWLIRQGDFILKYGHDFKKKAVLRYRCDLKNQD